MTNDIVPPGKKKFCGVRNGLQMAYAEVEGIDAGRGGGGDATTAAATRASSSSSSAIPYGYGWGVDTQEQGGGASDRDGGFGGDGGVVVDQSTNDDAGSTTVVVLHGNPTSSYVWRNILPRVAAGTGRRAVAPDLIGMGDSDKLPDSGPGRYSFLEHAEYLDRFLEDCVDRDEKVVLVVHDWGSALGFWWAYRHPDWVRGVAYMEAMVRSFDSTVFGRGNDTTFVDFLELLRTPGVGETLILEQNIFVEQILPGGMFRNLTPGKWPRTGPRTSTPARAAVPL